MFKRKIGHWVLTAALLGLTACGGGGGDGEGGVATGSGLVGTWTTDVGTIVADNPGIFAGIRGTCSGPVVLVLQADGRFAETLDGRCIFEGGINGTATSNYTGNYRVEGNQMIVSGTTGSGQFSAGGISQSFALIADGAALYTLTGNQLELRPASGPGTVQRFTRSGG